MTRYHESQRFHGAILGLLVAALGGLLLVGVGGLLATRRRRC
jgi:hypothetical protein